MASESAAVPLGVQVRNFLVDRRVRFSVGLCIASSSVYFALGQLPHDLANFRDPATIVGLLLVFFGLMIRTWAAGILLKGKALATIGPYGICRHPLYLGTALLVAGFATIFPGIVNSLPALVPMAIIFWLTMRREEQRMAGKYGPAWDAYAGRTPRLIPHRPPATIVEGWSLSQWLRSREYNAILAASLLLTSLAVWSEFQR